MMVGGAAATDGRSAKRTEKCDAHKAAGIKTHPYYAAFFAGSDGQNTDGSSGGAPAHFLRGDAFHAAGSPIHPLA